MCLDLWAGLECTVNRVGNAYFDQIVRSGHLWSADDEQRKRGADVRAVTAWALLGAFDWNCLLTHQNGYYEPGIFDVRAMDRRPTALARMLRQLANGEQPDHPSLADPGWWLRPERIHYRPEGASRPSPFTNHASNRNSRRASRPILITGANGTLGNAFARICPVRGLSFQGLSRAELDIADPAAVAAAIARYNPWAVVNAAGYVRVDAAEQEPEICFRANAEGAAVLAQECRRGNVRLVTFSSDLVFDGAKSHPYTEGDATAPRNVYGKSKASAEERVLRILSDALVIRTSAFFGPWDSANFVVAALTTVASGGRFLAASDTTVSPTYVPDLVNATLNLLVDGDTGIWHIANPGEITWADLAVTATDLAGLDPSNIESVPMSATGATAPRPPYTALSSRRGRMLPPLRDALRRCIADHATLFKLLGSPRPVELC